MQLLQSLRVNCFAAALLPCLFACAGLIYQQQRQQAQLLATYASAANHELITYAALLADASKRPAILASITHAEQHWKTLAIVNLDQQNDDLNLLIDPLIGTENSLEIDNPPPALIKSQVEAQQWRIGSLRMAMACPLHDASSDKDLGVLYAEIQIPEARDAPQLLIIIGVAIYCGIMLAWYLSKRIYQPIEYLCHESDILLSGKTQTGTPRSSRSSVETAAIASSIGDLLARYQEKNHIGKSSNFNAGSSADDLSDAKEL